MSVLFPPKCLSFRKYYFRAGSFTPAAVWEKGWGEACKGLLKLVKNLPLAENRVNLGVITLSKVQSHYNIQLF